MARDTFKFDFPGDYYPDDYEEFLDDVEEMPEPVEDVREVVVSDESVEIPEEAPKGVVYRRLPNGGLIAE